MAIDRIPLPSDVPGRLYATGFTDVGPDPDAALRAVGADTLLCLLTDEDIGLRYPAFATWLRTGVGRGRAWWFPIDDGGIAHDDAMLDLVGELVTRLRAGQAVVAHCGAGIGRTSLACGLVVVALAGLPLQDALDHVRAARSGAGPENPVQRAHLQRLAQRLRPSAAADGRTAADEHAATDERAAADDHAATD